MTVTSERGLAMKGYMPPLLAESAVTDGLIQAQGEEFDLLRQAISETLAQFYVDTATWGLDQWEDLLGLAPDGSLDDAGRRERVKARLRGTGTATISVIQEIAGSYENGEVAVIEDHAAYTVIIRFISDAGVPDNLPDLESVLRAVVPAHLDVQFRFRFTTWDLIDLHGWRWDDLDALHLVWNDFEQVG